MAKGIKTGGRKPNTPNKVYATREAKIAATGITPLDYILGVMRDPLVPYARRDDMAKAAAAYCHSKMPTAIVMPPPPAESVAANDEALLNTYLAGLHADES